MKNTVILFDLDGTLIDSTEAILESFSAAYAHFGQTCPQDEAIKTLIGQPLEVMFVMLGLNETSASAYSDAYRAHYRTIHTARTSLLTGAREAVEQAATFAHLGIVTTKTTRYSIELMEHLKLMHHFEILIGQNDVRHPKPHPEPILKALEALPTVTGGEYMIGDTCMDMKAAQAADTVGMGVLCGYSSRPILSQCTENLFENASDAVTRIAKS